MQQEQGVQSSESTSLNFCPWGALMSHICVHMNGGALGPWVTKVSTGSGWLSITPLSILSCLIKVFLHQSKHSCQISLRFFYFYFFFPDIYFVKWEFSGELSGFVQTSAAIFEFDFSLTFQQPQKYDFSWQGPFHIPGQMQHWRDVKTQLKFLGPLVGGSNNTATVLTSVAMWQLPSWGKRENIAEKRCSDLLGHILSRF